MHNNFIPCMLNKTKLISTVLMRRVIMRLLNEHDIKLRLFNPKSEMKQNQSLYEIRQMKKG